jgi:hypothetical protein
MIQIKDRNKSKIFTVPAMTEYEEVEVQFHAFLILAKERVSSQVHSPAALLPAKEPSVSI